jgi:hypothetical protein
LRRCDDGNNDRGYCSERFEILMNRAQTETDPERRLAMLRECEEIITRTDVPMLILCQRVDVSMYEPGRLVGLSRHPRLTQQLWRLNVARH